jgi:hypothetical protein
MVYARKRAISTAWDAYVGTGAALECICTPNLILSLSSPCVLTESFCEEYTQICLTGKGPDCLPYSVSKCDRQVCLNDDGERE